jgi:hypothetical protein
MEYNQYDILIIIISLRCGNYLNTGMHYTPLEAVAGGSIGAL